jgi:hypothetical protein
MNFIGSTIHSDQHSISIHVCEGEFFFYGKTIMNDTQHQQSTVNTSVNCFVLYRAVQFTRVTAWSSLDRQAHPCKSLCSSVQSFPELHSSPLVTQNTLEIIFCSSSYTQSKRKQMHCKMNIYVLLCLMSIWKRLDFEVAKLFAVTGKVIKLQHKC